MAEKEIGRISHYYSKIGVAVIELKDAIKVGDRIHIKGHTANFEQDIGSMQIEHQKMDEAHTGQSIGLKVSQPCHEHDTVYLVA